MFCAYVVKTISRRKEKKEKVSSESNRERGKKGWLYCDVYYSLIKSGETDRQTREGPGETETGRRETDTDKKERETEDRERRGIDKKKTDERERGIEKGRRKRDRRER